MRLLALLVLLLPATAGAAGEVSSLLYLNRCSGTCTIVGGTDDARAMASSLPCAGGASCAGGGCFCSGGSAGTYTIEEFENYLGETGTAADEEWAELVQCVREVYSPYNITITDVRPDPSTPHTMGIVAGIPENIGYDSRFVGGIATNGNGCQPKDNVISFSFANTWKAGSQRGRVLALCYVVAQETAHAFGLEHAFEFSDGRSACTDPMSYRTDCGGQRFFRNKPAKCGENMPRSCACGLQNSHQRLLSIFGPGTPITAPPTLTVNAPEDGATVGNGATVVATAAAQRGVERLELWLNGYRWLTVKGATFGPSGQPETSYPLTFPADVPDGVIDIVVKAYDDIDAETVAPAVTVTKGAPCTSADTCAKGQKCEEGRCFWDPPAGQLGDPCEYNQFCISNNCISTTAGDQYCSQPCVVGVEDSCPMGFMCTGEAGQSGLCVFTPDSGGGCCDVGADGKAPALLSLLVFGLVLRRRRR